MQTELRPQVPYIFSMCSCIPFRAFSLPTTDAHNDVASLIMAGLTQERSHLIEAAFIISVCVRAHTDQVLSVRGTMSG